MFDNQNINNPTAVPVTEKNLTKLLDRKKNEDESFDAVIERLLAKTEDPVTVDQIIETLRKAHETVVAIEAKITDGGYTVFTVRSPDATLEQDFEIFTGHHHEVVVERDDGSEVTRQFHAASDPYGLEPALSTLVYCDGEVVNRDGVSVDEGTERFRKELLAEVDSDS
jgi:predicted CopG family antitoxin